MILAVDTSLPLLSIALADGEQLLGSIAVQGEGSRNEKLLPLIDVLLKESDIELASIALFAVTRGPGSFTGTRVGLATLQGIALGVSRPLRAMSTHEAIAWSEGERRVIVSSDAGRGEYYVSAYERGERAMVEQLMTAAELESHRAQYEVHLVVERFVQQQVPALWLARKIDWLQRMSRLDAYQDATPIYVRLAEAEVKLQQRGS